VSGAEHDPESLARVHLGDGEAEVVLLVPLGIGLGAEWGRVPALGQGEKAILMIHEVPLE
jgi:hypothetical protein